MITDLRIHQDVNHEIMTKHNNSDPLRLTGGVSKGCPSAPLRCLYSQQPLKKSETIGADRLVIDGE